jgi:type II secretory pathway pseudopilin PulG
MRAEPKNRDGAFTSIELLAILAVLIALFALLVGHVLAGRSRARAQQSLCASNLMHIGIAVRLFATDHHDRFPMSVSTNAGGCAEWVPGNRDQQTALNTFRVFLTLSNDLATPRVTLCPADTLDRILATNFTTEVNALVAQGKGNRWISYFVGVDAEEGRYQMLLAGDRNLTNGNPPVLFNAPAGCFVRLGGGGKTEQLPDDPMGAGWSEHLHRHIGNAVLADGSVQRRLTARRLREQLKDSGDGNNVLSVPGKN